MAITQVGSAVERKISAAQTNIDHTSLVVPACDIMIATYHMEGLEVLDSGPTWNTSEALTLIHDTGALSANSRTRSYVYGIISPTATTATLAAGVSTSGNPMWGTVVYYDGVDTASVAAATNYHSENALESPLLAFPHASAGTAGNAMVCTGVIQGADHSPASNATGFTEVFDTTTGGSAQSDFACYYAHLLDAAPEAITITWSVDAALGSSIYFELVAASGGGGTTLLQTQIYQGMNSMTGGFRK